MYILYCKTRLLLLRWDTGKVRHRFGCMGRFKGGWVNSVTIDVIKEFKYRYNYMQVFLEI